MPAGRNGITVNRRGGFAAVFASQTTRVQLNVKRKFCAQAIFAPTYISSLGEYKWRVKVFNSSVENRVEKAPEEIETARHHGAYSSLHKFRADLCGEEGS
jgi:hypothetical protein